MPTDIRASYMYMESIARFADADFAETTLNSWRYERVMNDVLRVMAQHIYRLMDYDPGRFIQYMDEVNVRTGIRYTASIRTIFSQISNTIAEALPSTGGRDALVALCESSYILRIKVRSVDSMPTYSSSRHAEYIYQVTADVLDTLKGHVFAACSQDQQSLQNAGSVSAQPLSSYPACIQFVYLNNLYFDPRTISPGPFDRYTGRDPEFAFGRDSLFAMNVGQEAVVFAVHNGHLIDSAYDYYHVRLDSRTSFGALPIINDQVRDINHIWSDQTMLSYEEWRRQFMMMRNRLLSGRY